jgi:hypothetical protein
MDALYLFKQNANDGFELRHSLRTIEMNAPYIRKVWIFGDRPSFMSNDVSVIEHVPQEYLAPILGVKTPLSNFFLMIFLSSLIPDLDFEYLRFSDDFFLLKDFPIEEARRDRYFEDLTPPPTLPRGTGPWRESLWRTRDLLVRLGYTAFNFETHVPAYMMRKRVLEAYCEFRDFVTEDRWFGMMGATAILNHAHKHEKTKLISIKDENSRGGFWGKPPLSYEAVLEQVQGKTFFSFDDHAFNDHIARFLRERYPKRSRFERE